jgi:hypothetical protein
MKKIALPLLSFLVFACSTDSDVVSDMENEELVNGAPSIASQSFIVDEHSVAGTVIGNIQASDNEDDILTYTIDVSENILINENTGALSIGEGLKLDFESNNSLNFTVSVFDGAAISDADITLNIEDINEFDTLNEGQKEVVTHFKHLTLFQDPTSPTQTIMRKWDEPMKLYLVGDFPEVTRTMVEEVIANYNMLTASGSFNITLVDTESESTAQLFYGTKQETESVFPNMYEQIKDLTLDGYAISSFVGNSYRSAEIWISSQTAALFTHEMGHALGLGHSNLCDGESASAMCSTISPNNELLDIENKVISFFYNENMPTGLNEQEIEDNLSNLILLED